ncbi:MAG: hypothetical protein JWO96_429 [Candidatus Saccharibacteria bacterium]|nr:hypothetical protein [Candidatus Saccharibacteria bacterium]
MSENLLEEQYRPPNTFEPRVLGALTIVGLEKEDEMNEMMIPEADEEIVSTLVSRPEGLLMLGCGDDRGVSHASRKQLEEKEGLPADQPHLRYFGGAPGLTRMAITTFISQYGLRRLDKLTQGKDFLAFSEEFNNLAAHNANVILTAHSAVQNELNDSELNPLSTAPLACAYALNMGEVSHIAGYNSDVRKLSAAEFKSLFGPHAVPENIDIAAEANRQFSKTELGEQPRKFSITRTNLLTMGTPTMLLKGDHAKSHETFLLANFSLDRLTDPDAAVEAGRPYYGIDFTHTAEVIMKSLPDQKLDPELLLANMMLDVAATRAALAAHDGPANPGRISLVRYGDPEEALEYLRTLNG